MIKHYFGLTSTCINTDTCDDRDFAITNTREATSTYDIADALHCHNAGTQTTVATTNHREVQYD